MRHQKLLKQRHNKIKARIKHGVATPEDYKKIKHLRYTLKYNDPEPQLSPERIAEIQSWAEEDAKRPPIDLNPTIHNPPRNIINVVHHGDPR